MCSATCGVYAYLYIWGVYACEGVHGVCLGLIFGRMGLLLPCLLRTCVALCKVFSVKKTSIKLPSRGPGRCQSCRDSFCSASFVNRALLPRRGGLWRWSLLLKFPQLVKVVFRLQTCWSVRNLTSFTNDYL